jgi:hypothetical protein
MRRKNCVICGKFIPKKNYKYCSDCHVHYKDFKNKEFYWREKFEGILPNGDLYYKCYFHDRIRKGREKK